MATLTIGEVDEEVARRLEARAAAAGRSAEVEARAILEAALGSGTGKTGWDLFRELRGTYPLFTDEEVEAINHGRGGTDKPVGLPD